MCPITWTSHPLRDESRLKSALLIAIILGVSLAVGFSFESFPFAILTLCVLSASISRYLLPTHYALDAEGVTISHMGMRKVHLWTHFRRADRHPDGVFLSPFARSHRLDTFRGHFLRADSCADEVYDAVRSFIAEN